MIIIGFAKIVDIHVIVITSERKIIFFKSLAHLFIFYEYDVILYGGIFYDYHLSFIS